MQVVLKRYEDKTVLPVQVDKLDATVRDLKEIISNQLRIHYDAQRLVYPNRELEDSNKLSDLQLQDDKYVYLVVRDMNLTSKFQVSLMDSWNRFNFRMHPWQKLSSLLEKISSLTHVPPERLQLLDYRGNQIDVHIQSDLRISKVLKLSKKYKLYYKVINDNLGDSESSTDAAVNGIDNDDSLHHEFGLCDLFT